MNQDATIPTPAEAPEVSQEVEGIDFEPSALLAELKAKAATEMAPEALPDHLPLSVITLLPELFQPREMVDFHIHELARTAKSGRFLDPVTLLQVGSTAYLIDGHHRIAAYHDAQVSQPIPVTYFGGTIDEAVLEAGRANSRAKLPMSVSQRMDYAWRLVKMGTYSKKQIIDAAVVSDGQVGTMRRVMKALGNDAFEYASWWRAKKAAEGEKDYHLSEEEREEWLEVQAQKYADRLAKAFTTKLATNPALAARALHIHFGRKLPELVYFLHDFVSREELAEEESDF